mgnify:CR=1 FL=1
MPATPSPEGTTDSLVEELPTPYSRHADAGSAGALTLAAYLPDQPAASAACDYSYETGPLSYASATLRVTLQPKSKIVTLSAPPLPQPLRLRLRLAVRPAAVLAPAPLPEIADAAAFRAATAGWRWDNGLLSVKLPAAS